MSTVVKDSEIEGRGVFANKNFEKDEVVIKWDTSHELTKEEVDNLSDDEKKYVSYLKGKYIFMQKPERYVNHSCDANTYAKDFSDVAKRDIKKGEEITGDYAEEEIPGVEMECKCESENCRGIIK